MRLPKWFVSISVLATIGIAVGWFWVGDEIASGVAADSLESAAATTVAPVQDQIPPPANALPVPDLLQTRRTAPPSEPSPTAAKVVVPAPAASPPQAPGLLTAEAHAQARNHTPDLGSNPEQAVSPPAETPAHPTAATDQEGAARASVPAVNPPLPPRSLQTLVDERRDQLHRQRDARLDASRGPRRQMPPRFTPYNDAAERYRDARRSQYGRQRDLGRQRHTSWMDTICPWAKPRRFWSARQSYQRQMEQLNRRAYRGAYRYRPPHDFPGPRGWR